MLLPGKHINISDSLFGMGGIILDYVRNRNTSYSIDSIIEYMINYNSNNNVLYKNISNILLSIDYLYTIGAINVNKEGEIILCI